MWEIEYTDQFEEWWEAQNANLQNRITEVILRELAQQGPALTRPYADTLEGSRHSNLKELRIGATVRILFAFDPRRVAILLIGGDKEGNPRWYDEYLPLADQLYDDHLEEIEKEE